MMVLSEELEVVVRPIVQDQQEGLRGAAVQFTLDRVVAEVVRGHAGVVALRGVLEDLGERCGQSGVLDHLEYFLNFKESLRKMPCVVLLVEPMVQSGKTTRTVLGALVLYEERVFGYGLKIFTTDDGSGRRTLIAPDSARQTFAKLAAKALMDGGARAAVQSFTGDGVLMAMEGKVKPKTAGLTYTTQTREMRSHLPLGPTIEATMARIGQRTRSNMRYYRRRAETQLGCRFIERVEVSLVEFQAFNRECSFAAGDETAAWRYRSLKKFAGMFLIGTKASDGRWLSMIGGRHFGDAAELDFQMNRKDLPEYSLSTMMRYYWIEYECVRSSKRLFIEGGTRQPLELSFTTQTVHDLVVIRNSWMLRGMRKMVPTMLRVVNRFAPKSNHPLRLLTDKAHRWYSWQ